jgi:hypothetical protein
MLALFKRTSGPFLLIFSYFSSLSGGVLMAQEIASRFRRDLLAKKDPAGGRPSQPAMPAGMEWQLPLVPVA